MKKFLITALLALGLFAAASPNEAKANMTQAQALALAVQYEQAAARATGNERATYLAWARHWRQYAATVGGGVANNPRPQPQQPARPVIYHMTLLKWNGWFGWSTVVDRRMSLNEARDLYQRFNGMTGYRFTRIQRVQ